MFARLCLRVLSLAAKFGLTIAITRVLGFAAVGEYGLAIAVSVIASKLFGLGFSAELNRRLSGSNPTDAIGTARELRGVYAGFYAIVGVALGIALLFGWRDGTLDAAQLAFLMLAIAVSEHYAFETNSYVFSLHLSRAGSALLFVRTGAWAAVAIAGLVCGAIDGIRTVMLLWVVTNLIVIAWSWVLLSNRANQEAKAASRSEPTRSYVRDTWKEGAPYFIGGVMLSALQYAERFVASATLPAIEVGRYVFVWSVANSVQTIIFACVGVIAGPKLARAANASADEWRATFNRALRSTVGIGVAIALGILCASPLIFRAANETVTPSTLTLLSTLLVSFVLRSIGDLLWATSVARRARARVLFAMCAAAIVSLPAALTIIPGHGALSIAVAHLLASVSVLAALSWAQRRANAGETSHA